MINQIQNKKVRHNSLSWFRCKFILINLTQPADGLETNNESKLRYFWIGTQAKWCDKDKNPTFMSNEFT